MEKPTLFIASSTKAQPLALALYFLLMELKGVSADVWYAGEFPNNSNLLHELLSKTQTYDFAAVLLTEDDVIKQEDSTGTKYTPRDNCVFELGLFIGAFQDPSRCFLISQLDPDILPSDLGGQVYEPISKNLDFSNPEKMKEALKPIAAKLTQQAIRQEKRQRLTVSTIGLQELMSEEGKHLTRGSSVYVRSVEPLETERESAEVVINNLGMGTDYLYFFDNERAAFRRISNMLQTISVAGLVDKAWDVATEEERIEMMTGKEEDVRKNLELMTKYLYVTLVDFGAFDEFAIHSPKPSETKAYLKWGANTFIVEDNPEKARARLQFYDNNYRHFDKHAIFSPGQHDDKVMLAEARRLGLEEEIADRFPEDLKKDILTSCFGSDTSGEVVAGTAEDQDPSQPE